MRTLAVVVPLCLVVTWTSAQDARPVPADAPAAVTLPPELDRVLRDYEAAWRDGDGARLASLFIDDGFAMQNGSPVARGHAAIAGLLARVQRRVRRLLIRRGRWPGEDAGRDPFAAAAPLFASAVAASLQGCVALGPRAGQPVRRLRSAADAIATGRRSARLEGFSLHADVAVPARRRDQLERVCRLCGSFSRRRRAPLLYRSRATPSDQERLQRFSGVSARRCHRVSAPMVEVR